MNELFPNTTNWSMVRRAADNDNAAWQELIEKYSHPIECCFRRRLACRAPWLDSDEVVDDFFTALWMNQQVKKADPSKGTFRSWIQHCAKWYLSSALAHMRALPDLPKDAILTEEDVSAHEVEGWMRGLLENALAILETEKSAWAEVVKLRHGLSSSADELKPAAVAKSLGLRRKQVYGQYELAIDKLRRIILRLIREAATPDQYDAEYDSFNEWVKREFPRLARALRS